MGSEMCIRDRSTYILNSLLFFLMGYVLLEIAKNLSSDTLTHALQTTVVLYLVMLLARCIFMELSIYTIRMLDCRPSQRARRTTFRDRLVSSLAGFRGGISLAVALSIPAFLADGEAFPSRDVVIFVTSGIVILSLVVQGALLPLAVRWQQANPNVNWGEESLLQEKEIRGAMIDSMRNIAKNLDSIAVENEISEEITDRVRQEMTDQKKSWERAKAEGIGEKVMENREEFQKLRLAIVRRSRQNMIQYRDEGKIDDEALIYLLELLDMDEIRITGPVEME